MTLDQIIVTAAGAFAVFGVYWFFLGKREEAQEVRGSVEIVVEGGYRPSAIRIPKGKPATLTFVRKDPSGCLEEVVLAEWKIRKTLPLNEKVDITITPQRAGEFAFTCGMNMYRGTIIVE